MTPIYRTPHTGTEAAPAPQATDPQESERKKDERASARKMGFMGDQGKVRTSINDDLHVGSSHEK